MKLDYRNNWESDEYSVGGRRVLTLEKVRIDKVDYKVTSKEVTIPYYDMGHQYTAHSTHYFVKTKIFGKVTEVDLNTVKVPITALKYELEPKK